ncbi:probable glutathione S-transferase BZ2 [Phragmites australis]|uniref:probable glutathione S-transferase BZ2 n=1 Tax=Phragmites australis TaxID=29695 RepID=UPI002D77DF72|nr:probable glutathione S-transferase BZ2 [Phragmites australis]
MAAAAAAVAVRVLGGEVSPFTARARLALELRGVAYELLDEPLGPQKSERLLAANPVYGKIPVLLLPDGRAICESAVIVQYVEDDVASRGGGEEAGGRLLPEDPYERAMHRFWTVYVDDKFWPALDAISLAPTPDARAQATADARAALRLLEEAFKSLSNGAAFFSGHDTAPGLLDVALGCFLPAIRACERLHGLSLLDASATPLMQRWSERFAALPAARRVLPETENVVQFTRFLQAKFGVDVSK